MANETVKIHPHFVRNNEYYTRVRDILSPDPKKLINDTYVTRYTTEKAKDTPDSIYNNRLQRTYAITFADAVIDEHTGTLSQQVDVKNFGRSSEEEPTTILDDILEDLDGKGNNLSEFFRKQAEITIAYGMHGVLVSGPEIRNQSAELQRKLRERSFCFLYEPWDILNWERYTNGRFIGKLKSVLLIDETIDETYTMLRYYEHRPDINGYSFTLYKTKSLSLKNLGVKDIAVERIKQTEFSNTLGIPFVVFGEGPSDSFVNRVVHLDLALLNRLSAYSNTNFLQGFRQLIFTGISDIKDFLKKISENIVGVTSSKDVQVHQIPAGDPSALENEIRMIMHWARRFGMFQMRQLTDDMVKQNPSAESKAKDLEALDRIYNAFLDHFEKRETELFQIIGRFEITAPTDELINSIQVTIARDFNLNDNQFDLEQDKFILFVSSYFDSETKVEIAKEVVKKYLAKMRFIPTKELTEEQARNALLEKITNAKPEQVTISQPASVFGSTLGTSLQQSATPQPVITNANSQE